ncbi:hypothetical protein [Burkholderia anthina]|nr:hypothetical protein [Burkholderia anthina]
MTITKPGHYVESIEILTESERRARQSLTDSIASIAPPRLSRVTP